jgi:hypothetical protein
MAFDNGFALVVGVGAYQDASLSAPVTAGDAQALSSVLQDPEFAGYPAGQVRLLTGPEATRRGVLQALGDLATASKPESTVVIFVCGHGVPAPGGGYRFLTHDARRTAANTYAPSTVVTNDELVASIQNIAAQKVLVLLNTCFAGVVAGNLAPAEPDDLPGAPPPDQVVDELLATGEGRVIISACRSTQRSWFHPGANLTVFTEALLEGLQGSQSIANRQGYIGVFELYSYVFDRVSAGVKKLAASVDQEPVITIREGVGPFPVALYRGGQSLSPEGVSPGVAPALDREPPGDAAVRVVRVVPQIQAGRDVNQTTARSDAGGVVNTGTAGNINTGGTQLNIGGVSAGRDAIVGGTVQVSSTEYRAPGDRYSRGEAELARTFAEALRQAQELSPEDRELVTPVIKQAQEHAEKLQQGDTSPETQTALEKRLKSLAVIAPDIAEYILASLAKMGLKV